jgi:hydroxyacylglutathione hydrolase
LENLSAVVFIETISVGVFQCNCTVIACESTRQAIVIDPGDEPKKILEIIRTNGFDVRYVLHTHAHIDHIMGTFEVVQATGAVTRLHEADRPLWERVGAVAASYHIPAPRVPQLLAWLRHDEVICFGCQQMRVIHTPGHTPGSCSFVIDVGEEGQVLFSGDTLFRGKIGLTPSFRGRKGIETILGSIRERLLTLDDETRVIPGHGRETRIGSERRTNPFLMEAQ